MVDVFDMVSNSHWLVMAVELRPYLAPSSNAPTNAIDRAAQREFQLCKQIGAHPIAVMAQLVLSQAGVLCPVRVIDIIQRRDP